MIAPVLHEPQTLSTEQTRAVWHIVAQGKLISSMLRELLTGRQQLQETEAPDGRGLYQFAKAGLVIAANDLPDGGAHTFLGLLKAQYSKVPRLLLLNSPEELVPAITDRNVVGGYISLHDPLAEFLRVANAVSAGRFAVSKAMELRYQQCRDGTIKDDAQLVRDLTPRQFSVFELLAASKSVKECSVAMGISVKAVDSHKYRLMRRLGIHDRAEIVRLGVKLGICP